jgi:ribonuclease III
MRSYKKLFAKIGYCFNKIELLKQALRHRSMGKNSNERLEFLGDAVLNFVIAAELFHLYPDMKEGDLSRLRANLVNGDVIANLASEFELGKYLTFGCGELRSGGAKRKSILADAIEAIIGAIYLDGGFKAVEKCITSWFTKLLQDNAGAVKKDPKTLLQELLQMHKLALPIYTIASTMGASHDRTFVINCKVLEINKETIGIGSSKRYAERIAAEKMLIEIQNGNHNEPT